MLLAEAFSIDRDVAQPALSNVVAKTMSNSRLVTPGEEKPPSTLFSPIPAPSLIGHRLNAHALGAQSRASIHEGHGHITKEPMSRLFD
jgi:hypothetical protein